MDFRTLDRTWIVAEIGVNHEGDVSVAADLVRKAAAAGADAVKFQTFQIEHYISSVQPERRSRTEKFQLTRQNFEELAALGESLGVVFFSTPFDSRDADFLDSIAPLFKVSSGDLTHLDLIRSVAAKEKPLILSTGLGNRFEIADAVGAVERIYPTARERGHLMLMHCVSAYPTPAAEANLRNIEWLSQEFQLPVGYSDHTLGVKACELAVAAGAVAIEKHFTYRKEDQEFHDHKISADPDDLAELVSAIRLAEEYLGKQTREIGESERANLTNMRRSLGAVRHIPAGTPVRREWVTFLRPAQGIRPDQIDKVVGRSLRRSVEPGDLLLPEDVVDV